MRNAERIARLATLAAAAVLAGAACGASSSSGSVGSAEMTEYACKSDKMYAAAEAALKKEFHTTMPVDQKQGMVVSEPQWYSSDGKQRGKMGTPEGVLQKGDLGFAARVRITDLKPNYKINVDAVVRQHPGGSDEPVDIPEGDPRRPAWLQARLDRVAVDVHDQLSGCAALKRDAR